MRRRRSVLGLVVCVVSAAGWAWAHDRPPRDHRRTPVVEVFETCRDAVVNISTTKLRKVRTWGFRTPWDELFGLPSPMTREVRVTSLGSGFVIHEDGYIVTNAHVVAQATDISVAFADGRRYEAVPVASDPQHDLAILRLDAGRPLKPLRLGRPGDILIGETVVAIGNPLGLQTTVTAGIVSAINRTLHFREDVEYTHLIQTDAAINPGNSGGPLLNVNAELIGVNTAIRGDAQNVGFAIPVERVWQIVPAMLDIERHQRVAFGLRVVGPEAEVRSVVPGSPAEQAGIHPDGRVVELDGQPVRDAIDYYARLLHHKPGDVVTVTIRGTSAPQRYRVPLKPLPPPDGKKLARDKFGLVFAPIPPELRRAFRIPPGVGLLVEQVERYGPAARRGIMPGDIVLRINRLAVASLEDVGLVLEHVQTGQSVVFEGFDTRTGELWMVAVPAR